MKVCTPSRPDRTATGSAEGSLRSLFDELYPRVFAYVASVRDSSPDVPETVAEAFVRAFDRGGAGDGFHIRLFEAAYGMTRSLERIGAHGDGLSRAERHLLALVFDGGLRPAEAARVLGFSQGDAGELLLSGLRKLQAGAPQPSVA